MSEDDPTPPEALLLIAPGCSHCPVVLDALGRLVKEGRIGRLEVSNIAVHPEEAQAAGTRSVPWMRMGPFELEGTHSYGELRDWAAAASGTPDYALYFSHLLQSRRLDRVVEMVQAVPEALDQLISLAGSLDTPMAARIGVGAVLEELEGSELIRRARPALERLCSSEEPQVRADACHYLGLTGDPDAIPAVQRLTGDDDPDVREIAGDTLAVLRGRSEGPPGS